MEKGIFLVEDSQEILDQLMHGILNVKCPHCQTEQDIDFDIYIITCFSCEKQFINPLCD